MIKFIHHLFVPHKGNNHRSKILHNSSLFLLIALLITSTLISTVINKTHPEILGISYSISDQELLLLVNQKRIENGLNPLKLNSKLTVAAKNKADYMFSHNYWAHFAPDGTTPWKFIIESDYDYIYAGENLAKGFINGPEAVDAWMNSPTHRDNILSDQYDDVGFSIVEGQLQGEETVLIVQMFGQERNSFLANAKVESVTVTDKSAGDSALPDVNSKAEVSVVNAEGIAQNNSSIPSRIYESKPILDILKSSKSISFVLISILLVSLIIDIVVISKRRIPRTVGNNLDHILLLSIFVIFIFIYNIGRVA